ASRRRRIRRWFGANGRPIVPRAGRCLRAQSYRSGDPCVWRQPVRDRAATPAQSRDAVRQAEEVRPRERVGAAVPAARRRRRQRQSRRLLILLGDAVASRLHELRGMKTTTLVGRILFSLLFLAAVPGHFKSETI